ncbi:flagellar FlbD family protein [Terriglobus aquaticus]|uniref:Flagellar FlbD family protein n=1 Tax=Terriglobus aquaticus TaxID=940139 RepID=A0ABW9KMU4_9BACT|nr:flagellar FlbD family protein [Terriglobus aquaticus]
MVEMTRLNGHALLVNADLIKHVEAIPDTTLTLITGEKLVVLETCGEVLARTLAWRASLLRGAWPTADSALLAHTAFQAAAAQD